MQIYEATKWGFLIYYFRSFAKTLAFHSSSTSNFQREATWKSTRMIRILKRRFIKKIITRSLRVWCWEITGYKTRFYITVRIRAEEMSRAGNNPWDTAKFLKYLSCSFSNITSCRRVKPFFLLFDVIMNEKLFVCLQEYEIDRSLVFSKELSISLL